MTSAASQQFFETFPPEVSVICVRDDAPGTAATRIFGVHGARWRGDRVITPVPCPKCGRYSLVGVDRVPATDDRRSRR